VSGSEAELFFWIRIRPKLTDSLGFGFTTLPSTKKMSRFPSAGIDMFIAVFIKQNLFFRTAAYINSLTKIFVNRRDGGVVL
jgi:hypothetical protein